MGCRAISRKDHQIGVVAIDTAQPPASTAVQVAALFAPGYLPEVEAWALIGDLPPRTCQHTAQRHPRGTLTTEDLAGDAHTCRRPGVPEGRAHGRRVIAGRAVRVAGSVQLDSRPREAFKPVMLSAQSDAKDAFTGTAVYGFPASGWIIQPPVMTRDFGLQGATASTPTIEVTMDRSLLVTGWAGASVGLWSATTSVLSSWSYTLTAESGAAL